MRTDYQKLYEITQILDEALSVIEEVGAFDDETIDEEIEELYGYIEDKESYISYKLRELDGELK